MRFNFKTTLLGIFILAVIVVGCDRVKQGNDMLLGVRGYLSQEAGAYQNLQSVVGLQGEASVQKLGQWLETLNNLKGSVEKFQSFYKDHKDKIDKSTEARNAIDSTLGDIDKIFQRHYSAVEMKLVPPWIWDKNTAQTAASGVSGALRALSSSYQAISGKATSSQNFDVVSLSMDTKISDTYQPCVDRVAELAKGHAQSQFCVNAAKQACGHQVHLDQLATNFTAALSQNPCADSKHETFKILSKDTTNYNYKNDTEHFHADTEALQGDPQFGAVSSEKNPKRFDTAAVFCKGSTNLSSKTIDSNSCSADSSQPMAIVFGIGKDTNVIIRVRNLHSQVDAQVTVNVYVDTQLKRTEILPPQAFTDGGYDFTISNAAFRVGTPVKLVFPALEQGTDTSVTPSTAVALDWIVNTSIQGTDEPTVDKTEVTLNKYSPNTWLSSVVGGCVAKPGEVINK